MVVDGRQSARDIGGPCCHSDEDMRRLTPRTDRRLKASMGEGFQASTSNIRMACDEMSARPAIYPGQASAPLSAASWSHHLDDLLGTPCRSRMKLTGGENSKRGQMKSSWSGRNGSPSTAGRPNRVPGRDSPPRPWAQRARVLRKDRPLAIDGVGSAVHAGIAEARPHDGLHELCYRSRSMSSDRASVGQTESSRMTHLMRLPTHSRSPHGPVEGTKRSGRDWVASMCS